MPATPKVSRAVALLRRVAADPAFDREAMAGQLVVPVETLDAFLSGTQEIPLSRQLVLALYVIENVPKLARQGHALKGQVQAAAALEGGLRKDH